MAVIAPPSRSDARASAQADHKQKYLHISLAELAQLYSQIALSSMPMSRAAPSPLAESPARDLFEDKLSLFQQNTVDALKDSAAERPAWPTRLWRWIRRQKPRDPMIHEYFFCDSLPAGIVLFCEPSSRLYLTFPPDARAPVWITDLLVRAETLYIEIREVLHHPNRGICLEMVFAVIVQLIKLMGNEDFRQRYPHAVAAPEIDVHNDDEDKHSTNGTHKHENVVVGGREPPLSVPHEWHLAPWSDLQRTYETQLSQASDLVRRMAQRQAQLDYFWGMVGGALVLGLVVTLEYGFPMLLGGPPTWMAAQLRVDGQWAPLLWLCPVIGGIGALVSVMQRMGSGTFALRDRAGTWALRFVGGFRPLIGAVFASVIVTMVFSGVVGFRASGVVEQNFILFYCVVAFFAGFSERWAQDMLGVGQAAVSAGSDAERRAAAT